MKVRHELRLFKCIETQVHDKICVGILEGHKKKFIVREVARDTFLAFFPKHGVLSVEGNRIATHIYLGAQAAATALNWKPEKATKHIAHGLLNGIRDRGGDFSQGACVVVRSAILSALEAGTDVSSVTERAIGAVLEAGREKDCNLDDLLRNVSLAAAETASYCASADLEPMKGMVLELLDGREIRDEDESRWQ